MTKSDETRLRNLTAKRESMTLTHDESNTFRRLRDLRDKEARESLDEGVQRAQQSIADSKSVVTESRNLIRQAQALADKRKRSPR